MINPSASGWIDKFFSRYRAVIPLANDSWYLFYSRTRSNGFVYGYVTEVHDLDKNEMKGWTGEEMTKTALLDALYCCYRLEMVEDNYQHFIHKATDFYKKITPESFVLLKKILPSSPKSQELEKLLEERIHTNDNIIERSFSHILTNALLFMDILAFQNYLKGNDTPEKYLRKLEEAFISIVSLVLKSKIEKSEYDDLLIKLFESSVRYTKFSMVNTEGIKLLDFKEYTSEIEKYYLLDMAGMALWSDGVAGKGEIDFLYNLAEELDIVSEQVSESIASFDVFMKFNKSKIPYFNYSNPVRHFYDHATQSVVLLIKRNSSRLVKELSNNGELVLLLTHSTHRSLDAKEKKKIKKQLLEICKTVPSLAIFLLPGGSLLLPLLIKFIPQMLPAMFNENLDKE